MTNEYYQQNAEAFFKATINVDMLALYDKFLPKLKPNSHILDAGCGAGRDSQFFIKQGHTVTAIDASEALAKRASEHIKQTVIATSFDDFAEKEIAAGRTEFDAIWACASLLHVPADNLPSTFNLLGKLLKTGGVFYCSFKYGDKDTSREQSKDGRSFTNCDESRLSSFVKGCGLSISQTWQSQDCRPGRAEEYWLNALLVKA